MIYVNNKFKLTLSLVALVAIIMMMTLSVNNVLAIPFDGIRVYTNYPAGTQFCAVSVSNNPLNPFGGPVTDCAYKSQSGWKHVNLDDLSWGATYNIYVDGCQFATNVKMGSTVRAGAYLC